MNKTTKYILYGVGTFAGCVVILAVARSLIKGIPVVDGFKDWTNWVIALLSGVSAAWSSFNKDSGKKDKQ